MMIRYNSHHSLKIGFFSFIFAIFLPKSPGTGPDSQGPHIGSPRVNSMVLRNDL
jgi:hypothetical protein